MKSDLYTENHTLQITKLKYLLNVTQTRYANLACPIYIYTISINFDAPRPTAMMKKGKYFKNFPGKLVISKMWVLDYFNM